MGLLQKIKDLQGYTIDTVDNLELANGELEPIDNEMLRKVPPEDKLRCFHSSQFPFLVLDRTLRIVYANASCERLYHGHYTLDNKYFTDVFANSLPIKDLKSLFNTIKTPKDSYSWKGIFNSKDRDSGTLMTRAYLFPFFAENCGSPDFFAMLIDDITDENRKMLRSVYLSLLEASKLKDNDTGKHIQRVNLYSGLIAEHLFKLKKYQQIDRDFIEDITFLAAMHDVGKIGTPDDILNKTGELEDWEWDIMKEHTKNGAYILSTYPNPMAREIALYHHERWDGSGYPYGLQGDMIPLSARIVALADVYDALRMKRSYKAAAGHSETLAMICESAGTHFDPYLCDIFLQNEGDIERLYEEHRD